MQLKFNIFVSYSSSGALFLTLNILAKHFYFYENDLVLGSPPKSVIKLDYNLWVSNEFFKLGQLEFRIRILNKKWYIVAIHIACQNDKISDSINHSNIKIEFSYFSQKFWIKWHLITQKLNFLQYKMIIILLFQSKSTLSQAIWI